MVILYLKPTLHTTCPNIPPIQPYLAIMAALGAMARPTVAADLTYPSSLNC